ncbi:hypothetical protein [Sphingobacterium thalpophilum]|uniref:hypothetical protein n=1 Tax=Sphingobacterium thalpophilum TaxID=259 RepID=UPI003C7922C7
MTKSSHRKTSYGQKEQARRQVFYHRLRIICEKMVGKGYFELLPESSLRLLYLYRYPEIKVIVRGKCVMNEEELKNYKQTLAELLSGQYIETLLGEKISYARFLTDALVLLHYIQYRVGTRIKGFSKLREVFAPYFTTTEWFSQQRTKIIQIMSINDLQLYDFYRGTVRFSFDRMAIEQFGGTNEIYIHRLAHSTTLQDIGGKKRIIVRLGVPSPVKIDEFDWISIRPSQLGMTNVVEDIPLPIYAQQHALDRFEERAVFWSGYVQAYIGYIIREGSARTIIKKDYLLLECYLATHKVGYFVISLQRDKWLIRTFLFLTNSGTPEGNKLEEMTNLKLLDRKHLMIDCMDAFLLYDIAGDKGLRKLFNKAGCGSLMKYADQINKHGKESLKSPDFIYRYMAMLK